MLAKTTIPIRRPANDFSRLLAGQKFREYGEHYYLLGNIKGAGGWGLNASIIKSQIPQALAILVPALLKEKVAFKVVRDLKSSDQLLSASAGYTFVGKILCVYPENEQRANQIAKKLIELTTHHRGPAVPTDVHLGGCVYTYYGAFDSTEGQKIPFSPPRGVVWPFDNIKPAINGTSNIIHNSYLIRSVIKSDAKGKVYNAIWAKGLRFRSCIIKEGLHDMFIDSHGRDIQERIKWQYDVLKILNGTVPTPKVYELFHENGNTYLSMERIKGVPLHDVIGQLHENQSWQHLSVNQRHKLLDYLIQLIGIISKIHNAGYIHRDISPANFIVDKRETIIVIDLELAYNYQSDIPSHPFESGVNGFTAPERVANPKPSLTEDIFSIGSTMAVFFTNLYPTKGHSENFAQLKKNFNYLIGDLNIADLIASCMHENPQSRPSLDQILTFLRHYKLSYSNSIPNYPTASAVPNLSALITRGLDALTSTLMINKNGLWRTNPTDENSNVQNFQDSKTVHPGLLNGISGILYTLAAAKKANLSTNSVYDIWNINYRHLLSLCKSEKYITNPGLFYGAAGISLCLSKAIESRLLSINAEIRNAIKKSEHLCSTDPTLATGAAGIGYALLSAAEIMQDSEIEKTLNKQLTYVLESQQKNGAWTVKGEMPFGVSSGAAGILLFLIAYNQKRSDRAVETALERGLHWLSKTANQNNSKIRWPLGGTNKILTPWLLDGFTGIALTFTRAYSMFRESEYASTASNILQKHPKHLITNNLSLGGGVSGIGEAYLEAAHVFDRAEYMEKAISFARLIEHTQNVTESGGAYWIMDNRKPASPALGSGISGVLHFLIKLYSTK